MHLADVLEELGDIMGSGGCWNLDPGLLEFDPHFDTLACIPLLGIYAVFWTRVIFWATLDRAWGPKILVYIIIQICYAGG